MGHGNICQTGDGYYLGFAIYEALTLTINDIIYITLNHCKQLPFERDVLYPKNRWEL